MVNLSWMPTLYARTGSLWYAEFVANSVQLLMSDGLRQYPMLITPLLHDETLLDTIPEESYVIRKYNPSNDCYDDSITFPLNGYAKNKKINAYVFYSRLTQYTDKPLEYIRRLGFPNIAVLIDDMYAFPYRNTGTSKKDMLEVASQAYEYDDKAFHWLLDFMKAVRKNKDFKLGVDKTIDIDWVKSNMDYSAEFLQESIPILDETLIDDDEYINKATMLINRIHSQQCALSDQHDAVICDNNVVCSYRDFLGLPDRISEYSPKQRWNLYHVVLDNLLSIPEDIWSLIMSGGSAYMHIDTLLLLPSIYLYRIYDESLSKKISYFSSSMFSNTDVDKIYRNMISCNMQLISYDRNYDPKNDFDQTLWDAFQKYRPKEIMKYIRTGVVSKTISFQIDGYSDICEVIQDNDFKYSRMGSQCSDKHPMNYHIMDIMNELPKTYREFMEQSNTLGMSGAEYLHSVIQKHAI